MNREKNIEAVISENEELKKALRLEQALEIVRNRAMLMKKSDELGDTSSVLFHQFQCLGYDPERMSIGVFNEQKQILELSFTGKHQLDGYANFFAVPLNEPHVIQPCFEAWKKGKSTFAIELKDKQLKEYIQFWQRIGLPSSSEFIPEKFVITVAFFSKGYLGYVSTEPLSKEITELLERFAGVFDLTYLRFMDLKNAEEQAREARVEAALERVRAKAMSMHKSDDLNAAVSVLFEQMHKLDLGVLRCGVGIMKKETRAVDVWVTTKSDTDSALQVSGDESFDIHPLLQQALDAWTRNEETNYVLKGEDMVRYYQALGSTNFHLPSSELMLSARDESYAQYYFMTPFTAGALFAFCEHEFTENAKNVIRRFSSVFNMTYKRFQDIQKAEAQTREARIETSLERVRAKAMGMHSSEDLMETINLFYHEVQSLSITPRRCGVSLIDKETRMAELSTMITTEEGDSKIVLGTLKLGDHPVLDQAFESWLNQSEFRPVLKGNEIRDYYKVITKQVAFSDYPEDMVQYGYYFNFPEGLVFAWTNAELSEDAVSIYRRFTSVLSLTYRRYKELQDAEERAQSRLEDFRKLQEAKDKIETTLNELRSTQAQLVHSEKMASLGELTAGIAHEIQNPLNFVNNFSEINQELLSELIEEVEKGNINGITPLANDLIENEKKISHHGKRADAIVKSMLQHSRKSTGLREPTDINALAEEYLRLSFHGMRAKDKNFNSKFQINLDNEVGTITVVSQDIGRVLLNLFNNAFYAVHEKKNSYPDNNYEPEIKLSTKRHDGMILISISDNGNGIEQKNIEKIFQPFFTTKASGQGTGLGLSISYDIIKAHNGDIKVQSEEGKGSELIVELPAEQGTVLNTKKC